MSTPYHSGERKVQELAGEVDSANTDTVITPVADHKGETS